MPDLIQRLINLGYSKEDATSLYHFYAVNSDIAELSKFVMHKESLETLG